jgi:4-hydroxy-2-oxoheptanedioate aldolase
MEATLNNQQSFGQFRDASASWSPSGRRVPVISSALELRSPNATSTTQENRRKSRVSETLLQRAWSADKPVFGGWCIIPSALSAEVIAQQPFDWVGIDWQHGFIDYEKTASMVQSISVGGAFPLVRVTANEPWIIMKALDIGAAGVIVPLVNNRAEAERAVEASFYPPIGGRSFGPVRNAPSIGVEPDEANQRVACFVMVETRQGFEDIDAICATPGLTGVFIGPDDLRLSMGAPKGDPDPAVIARVLDACRSNRIVAGIHSGSGDIAHTRAAQGFRLIAIGSDADFLADSASAAMAAARPEGATETLTATNDTVQAVVWSGL